MRKQQQIWEKEHKNPTFLPNLGKLKPSESLIFFLDYLKKEGIKQGGKAIDIGSGKGRNSIYLAKAGFDVFAIDYIQSALDQAKIYADKENLRGIRFIRGEIDSKWPFENNYFDLAIDCYSSIDIETKKGRDIYKNELLRTLKPGAYALIVVVSVNDEKEKELLKNNPGEEPNSAIWPETGKFQKNYDEVELRDFYKDFKILLMREVKKDSLKLGEHYTSTNIELIVRKI
jgi:SAM-dependent methyltransferase